MNTSFKGLILIIFLAISLCALSQTRSYEQLYAKECEEAKFFYAKNKNLFQSASSQTGLPIAFLFSIVAPEVTQYSHLSNKIESYSLNVFYAQNGSEYANFSIGYFQMQPAFLERIEDSVTADAILKKKYADLLFKNPNERASRVTRIKRLNSIEWQIRYLTLFCEMMQKRFGHLSFESTEEHLRFYSASYNCGFHKSEQQVRETGNKALFPHFSRQKFRYADISAWFYRQLKEEVL